MYGNCDSTHMIKRWISAQCVKIKDATCNEYDWNAW